MSDNTYDMVYFGRIAKVYGGSGGDLVAVDTLAYDAIAVQTGDSVVLTNVKPVNRPEGVTSRVAARVGDLCLIQICQLGSGCRDDKTSLLALTEVDRFEDC